MHIKVHFRILHYRSVAHRTAMTQLSTHRPMTRTSGDYPDRLQSDADRALALCSAMESERIASPRAVVDVTPRKLHIAADVGNDSSQVP